MMRSLLFPAVALMNRLKYLQKFLLIGVLFMLPVGLTMYMLVTNIDKEINFAKNERLGIEYNNGIRKLLEHLQQHRGMANANLNGDTSFKELLLEKQTEIEQDIRNVDRLDQRLGGRLKTTDKWNSIKDKWTYAGEKYFSFLSLKKVLNYIPNLLKKTLNYIPLLSRTCSPFLLMWEMPPVLN